MTKNEIAKTLDSGLRRNDEQRICAGTASSSVAAGCQSDDQPERTKSAMCGTRRCRQIGSFTADSRSLARLRRDRFIVGRGRMPIRRSARAHQKRDVRHKEVPPNRQLYRRFEKRGAAMPRPLLSMIAAGCPIHRPSRKTKRPPLLTAALDEEHRRDSMLQGFCLSRPLAETRPAAVTMTARWASCPQCSTSAGTLTRRRRACPDLPGFAPPCLRARAGSTAWPHAPCRDA